MTAIDLSRDLELWVDFDSEYWDAQRNQIQDQSGYGRHPEAIGGPTVGVEGPNDFEAASFDGSDDEFVVQDDKTKLNVDPITVFGLYKPDTDTADIRFLDYYYNSGDGVGILFRYDNGSWGTIVWDGGQPTTLGSSNSYINSWNSFCLIINNGTAKWYENGKFIEDASVDDPYPFKESFPLNISNDGDWQGDISITSVWSRALTDAEIEYLNNLTAPRRSQL